MVGLLEANKKMEKSFGEKFEEKKKKVKIVLRRLSKPPKGGSRLRLNRLF